jgi:uncharacterized protein YbcV (DUF1398 family)
MRWMRLCARFLAPAGRNDRYEVDFHARTVAYYGCNGEEYIEKYPALSLD